MRPRMPGYSLSRVMCAMSSVSRVAARRQQTSLFPMRLGRHHRNAGCRDPAVVEVEQRAGGDGEVDRLVVPSGVAKGLDLGGAGGGKVLRYARDEAEHCLLTGL